MRSIDRILACTARAFGISSRRSGSVPHSDRIDGARTDEADRVMLECCAAEGLAAERLMREVQDAPRR
jgi:hypothetical protein